MNVLRRCDLFNLGVRLAQGSLPLYWASLGASLAQTPQKEQHDRSKIEQMLNGDSSLSALTVRLSPQQ